MENLKNIIPDPKLKQIFDFLQTNQKLSNAINEDDFPIEFLKVAAFIIERYCNFAEANGNAFDFRLVENISEFEKQDPQALDDAMKVTVKKIGKPEIVVVSIYDKFTKIIDPSQAQRKLKQKKKT